jgi:2-hydroxycyclohexanecarboxyl-CoA dehydrogenase
MRGLKDRIAIVTGGGSGIGEAICRRMADEGVHLAILDRDLTGAERVAALARETGVRALAVELDIGDYAAVVEAVAAVERELGPADILVNNAGWDKMVRFLDTDEALRDEVIRINLKGPVNVTHAVASRMAARKAGRIVTISSDAGRVGSSGQGVYSACKGGMISLSKTLARELARSGILLNVVCPGPTRTPLMDRTLAEQGDDARKILDGMARGIPLRRIGEPEDVAGIVAFLASDEAGFITGQVVSVSGGLTMHG